MNGAPKVVIIHFQPLERFPPVMNLLDYMGNKTPQAVKVLSTTDTRNKRLHSYTHPHVHIRRTPGIDPVSRLRIFNYFIFYFYSLVYLLWQRPDVVLYYETLSSWPALVYKKLRKDKVRLFTHCHEYTSPKDYGNMWLVRKMHAMETAMYGKDFDWISHTNEKRIQQFRTDHGLQNLPDHIYHSMPNYPPLAWKEQQVNFAEAGKLRLVFVGSLGYENMYLREIVEWVSRNSSTMNLTFFSYNIDEKAKKLLSGKGDAVVYHEGIDYKNIPAVLKNYDIGLVLYKPYNFNHINGISNKVYEYLACGLDVWFPEDNLLTRSIGRNDVYPKIVPIDFHGLDNFNAAEASRRSGLQAAANSYFAENIYKEIYNEIYGLQSIHRKKEASS